MRCEAELLTYNTEKKNFESVYERNKFYRGLFGYKQTVKRNGKKYEYEKNGIMDEVPNIRIDNSVFIIANSHIDQVQEYFEEWRNKVTHHFFTVIIDDEDIIEKMHWKKDTTGEL